MTRAIPAIRAGVRTYCSPSFTPPGVGTLAARQRLCQATKPESGSAKNESVKLVQGEFVSRAALQHLKECAASTPGAGWQAAARNLARR